MCLIGLLGLIAPRVVFILLWIFAPAFVLFPFDGLWFVPLLGLILLPTTTYLLLGLNAGGWAASADCWCSHGLLIDLGLLGAGRGVARR